MFKVIKLGFVYDVYAVERRQEMIDTYTYDITYFLIFNYGKKKWEWVNAENYKPKEFTEGVI